MALAQRAEGFHHLGCGVQVADQHFDDEGLKDGEIDGVEVVLGMLDKLQSDVGFQHAGDFARQAW